MAGVDARVERQGSKVPRDERKQIEGMHPLDRSSELTVAIAIAIAIAVAFTITSTGTNLHAIPIIAQYVQRQVPSSASRDVRQKGKGIRSALSSFNTSPP